MGLMGEVLLGLIEGGVSLIRACLGSSSSVFTLLALIGGVFLGYFYGPYWGVRKVPGPPAIPLLGHLPMLARHGPDVFSLLAKRYGPIFRFHMGRQPLVIIADPELCREVGIKKFKDVANRSIPSPIAASPLHQKGLFFTKDTQWSTMRNAIISFYQPTNLANLVPTMQNYIQTATETLPKDQDISFSNLSLKLATDIIGHAAFGVNFGLCESQNPDISNTNTRDNDDDIMGFINQHIYSTTTLKMDLSGSLSMILGLLVPVLQEPIRQVLKRIPFTMDSKVDRTNQNLSNRLNKIVEKRMKDPNRDSNDILSRVLRMRDEDTHSKNVFTSDYVSAITYEHLLAGSATTSFTMSSIVYLVSGHPEVEKKLLQEIDEFGPHDLMPTPNDLQHKFPYTDQVIKEAMRFYTVSPLIARETLRQVEIGGYLLPKGTWVWLAPGVLAKDPKNFPEPEKFKPERFDPSCEEEKQRHPYAHIPFGLGPRVCIGQKFSIQEIKLALVHLYRKYVFRHSPTMEKPLELEYGLVLNYKYGVKVRVVDRKCL